MDGPVDSCAHCGLPAPRDARYCCYGCELASRIAEEASDDHSYLYGTLSFSLVLSMLIMMLSLFLYAEDVFDAAAGDVELAWLRGAYRWASFALATPVMVLAGFPLVGRAVAQLRQRRLSMDLLIVIGAFAAFALSAVNLFSGRTGIYVDSAATAVVLATFGRYLEATARSRASRSLGPLLEMSRSRVVSLSETGERVEIAPSEIEPMMRIEIAAGKTVPVDLLLTSESAEVDLAVLTGESRPIALRRGELVPAGAVPIATELVGVAQKAARDSALARLSELARELGQRRSPLLHWADRFASMLTPGVAVIALCVFGVQAYRGAIDQAIIRSLAVVLAACPCSYAIASPLVHWMMLRRAFSRGVLIRSTDALEAIAHLQVIAFDKTGTLTRPTLSVTAFHVAESSNKPAVFEIIRALEQGNDHPVATTLLAHVGAGPVAEITERRFVPGQGVTARDRFGAPLWIGLGEQEEVVLRRGEEILARCTLDETLRPEAREAVAELRQQGVELVMLSGDADSRVARIGRALGIESKGRLSPEQKVSALQALGDHAAMVGDGINDAPALAGRLTGFTFGGAADLAKGVAQVTLLDADLRLVPWTLALARQGVRHIKWLIGASTAYNIVFVALAANGTLRPVWAGLSMLGSSLLALAFAAGIGDKEVEGASEPTSSLTEARA